MSHIDWHNWDGDDASLLKMLEVDEAQVDKLVDRIADSIRFSLVMLLDGVESPIEQKLLLALVTRRSTEPSRYMCSEHVKVVVPDHKRVYEFNAGLHSNSNLVIELQKPVGRYKADFFVTYSCRDCVEPGEVIEAVTSVCVEADGHDFHEKTKAQAKHDKQRDRFFVAEGHTLLRFTGSEIHRDATKCADEVLELLIKRSCAELERLWHTKKGTTT